MTEKSHLVLKNIVNHLLHDKICITCGMWYRFWRNIQYLSIISKFSLWSLHMIILITKRQAWYEHCHWFLKWWQTTSLYPILDRHTIIDMLCLKWTSHCIISGFTFVVILLWKIHSAKNLSYAHVDRYQCGKRFFLLSRHFG
jgi:hypothetical protein